MGYEDGAIKIGQLTSIPLGYVGEQDTRTIRIDVRDWLNEYPGSLVMVQVVRPVDRYKYLAALTMENGIIAWTVGPGETDYAGKGLAQIVLYNPDTKQEYKSRVVGTLVGESLAGFNEALEASDPAKSWVDRVWQHAFEAESAALSANLSATNAAASANRAKGYAEQAALSVDEFKKDAAPAIVQSRKSDIFAFHDSADRPLVGVRLFGKTTQNGTPTPSAPVPLVNAGAAGSITVKACGKNLLDNKLFPAVTSNGVTFSHNPDGGINVKGTASAYANTFYNMVGMLPPGTYTISNKAFDGGYAYIRQSFAGSSDITTMAGNSFTLTGEETQINVFLQVNPNTTHNRTVYIQIESGTTATAFESYKDGGSLTASTPGGIPGIPVGFGSGANIIDQWGQPWICDEIDFARGVYVQHVQRIVLDGDENITFDEDAFNVAGAIQSGGKAYMQGLCNSYPVATNYGEFISGDFAVCNWSNDALRIRHGGSTDVAGFKAWLAANPVTLYFPIATPVETPIPSDELEAFRAMRSLKPTTSFFTDCGAEVAVEYIADTKTYIERNDEYTTQMFDRIFELEDRTRELENLIKNSSDKFHDPYTGKNYQLGVENGKLILKEVTV